MQFILIFFGILKALELKLAHVRRDIDDAILFFHCMIKLDTLAVGL
jgi:hypothetical protein